MSIDDCRVRQYHQPPLPQQQFQQQRRPVTQPDNQWSSTASQSSHTSHHRHGDTPSRHLSFPVQPPQQQHVHGGEGHASRQGDGQQRRQNQQSLQPHDHRMRPMPAEANPMTRGTGRDQARYYEQQQQPAPMDPRRGSMSRPSLSQQYRKQFHDGEERAKKSRGSRERDQRSHYIEPQQPPPPLQNNFYPPPQHDERDFSRPQQLPEQQLPSKELANSYDNQDRQGVPIEDEFHDSLPPPLSVRRGPPPPPIPVELPDHPVRETPTTSASSSAEDEPVSIDDVLLRKRWSVHVISHLYQFQRQELSEYAHELVKFLRGNAVMSYEQEFGYSVMIRYTAECVVFQVVEARDLHAELFIEKSEQPQRQGQGVDPADPIEGDDDIKQRSGSFIVYFPKSAEDASSYLRPGPGAGNHLSSQRRSGPSVGSRSNENGSENSRSSSGARGDPRHIFLLRGDEELMSWVSSWVQRRFQCVIGLHVVQVTEENLRRVTRNWVIEALEREARVEKARMRKAEKLRKVSAASGDEMPTTPNGHHNQSTLWPMRAPLLLKYRSKTDTDVVKAFTMTMPWASVRRVHALMDGGVGSALGTVPEVVERLELLYFGNLKKDLATMELTGIQMEEVEVDTQGKVKFFKSTMVHSVLQSFLDIFVVQQVLGPTEPIMTF